LLATYLVEPSSGWSQYLLLFLSATYLVEPSFFRVAAYIVASDLFSRTLFRVVAISFTFSFGDLFSRTLFFQGGRLYCC
jgi:hypothetical protein